MQFGKFGKIITAGALATVMAASTLGFATTLADYPSPFVAGGTMPTVLVVGATAAPSDVVGAIDMATRLGATPTVSKTVTCSACQGTSAVTGVTGGIQITSDLNKTYIGATYQAVKTTLTATELPDLLATQSFTDKNSTTITYSQQILLGAQSVAFGTPSTETEPVLYSTFGSSNTYQVKAIFMGGLDTSAVDSNYKMTLFGKEYTFGGTNATNQSLELFSSTGAQVLTMASVGDTQTVTVGGTTYQFELKGYGSDGTTAYLYVNGAPSSTYGWAEGRTYTVGSTKVYVSDVSVVKTGADMESAMVRLFVGTDKLTLTNNTQVQKNDNALANTLATFESSGTKINSLTITIAPDVDTYLKDGGEFVDPVFGSFKFKIAGMSMPVTGGNRDLIQVAKNGNNKAKLTFTNKEGNQYAVDVFYYDTGGSTWKRNVDSSHELWIQECNESYLGGRNITIGDYFVLTDTAKKATYVYKYSSYNPSTDASKIYVTLQDVASGTSQKVYLNTSDPYLRIGESTFKVMWYGNAVASDYSLCIDLNGNGAYANTTVSVYTRGEAVVGLATIPAVNVTENPLYTISGSNEPGLSIVSANASYSSSDVGFTVSSNTSLSGGQIGTANKYRYMSAYGTYVETDTDADTVKIYYPGNRPSYAVVAIGTDPQISIGGTSGSSGSTTTYNEVQPVTTTIAKLDNEVTSADRTAKNVILVGGPCVNTMVAELADAGKLMMDGEALTCAAWNAKSTAGDYFGLIQVIDNAFTAGKAALVVAGSTSVETREATSTLQDYAAKGLSGTAVKIKNNVITPVTVG